jgi:excisionase family DNA binding protein
MESNQEEHQPTQEWTTDELAQAAGVSTVYIRRLCKNGTIGARKFGWAWLIPYEEGQRWLEERAAKLATESESSSSEDEATEAPLTES